MLCEAHSSSITPSASSKKNAKELFKNRVEKPFKQQDRFCHQHRWPFYWNGGLFAYPGICEF